MSTKVITCPNLFIGMDIHKKSWTLHFCIDLTIGCSRTFTPEPENLQRYVQKYFPSHVVSIAYEVSCRGYKAAREFNQFDWDTYVVNRQIFPDRPNSVSSKQTKSMQLILLHN